MTSFREFIKSGTSRSTKKLKPLHGKIASDLAQRLGEDYEVYSQGYGKGKEARISGRYFGKMVDIAIKRGGKMMCGVAVKFIMQNYSQNSNNYFENMLGETANIRSGKCPYFQIFIILDKLPYYKRDKTIMRWESFSDHNVDKYRTLSQDDTSSFMHSPNKTLVCVIHIPDGENINSLEEYRSFYRGKQFEITYSTHEYGQFSDAVILNDYGQFIEKVYHTVKSL